MTPKLVHCYHIDFKSSRTLVCGSSLLLPLTYIYPHIYNSIWTCSLINQE